MSSSKVLGDVDAHEEQGDLPAVERQPVDVGPGHLPALDDGRGQGEVGVVVGGRSGHRLRQVRGIRVDRLPTLCQFVNDHCPAVHPYRRLCAHNPISAGTFWKKLNDMV